MGRKRVRGISHTLELRGARRIFQVYLCVLDTFIPTCLPTYLPAYLYLHTLIHIYIHATCYAHNYMLKHIHTHTHTRIHAYISYGQGLSDHAPLLVSFGRHGRTDSSNFYLPKFVCTHPEFKLHVNSIALYCDLLEIPVHRQLAV